MLNLISSKINLYLSNVLPTLTLNICLAAGRLVLQTEKKEGNHTFHLQGV